MGNNASIFRRLRFYVLPAVLLLAGFLLVGTLYAAEGGDPQTAIDWLKLSMELFGGPALFLGVSSFCPKA